MGMDGGGKFPGGFMSASSRQMITMLMVVYIMNKIVANGCV